MVYVMAVSFLFFFFFFLFFGFSLLGGGGDFLKIFSVKSYLFNGTH